MSTGCAMILVLWAAFLLVHLGGPDSMIAFPMEDNSLWMRFLIGLVAQSSSYLWKGIEEQRANGAHDTNVRVWGH